ncbi:hypothetical protein [Mycolicibacterium pyrenivorans]|uniref:hypothetical protein n=1 Tax=Mycolicibacterium pyrenivorans TaxID=187102 RepID=UPI0021F371D5|nr:hypothetical protein [Mycolicibacterium pyrenivorans]MCV7149723.1 hypothetical protein [Mycolicibacterium pyrenivorans]
MARLVLVLAVTVTTVFALVTGVNVANAEPPPPCSFTLSPPQVEQVNGVAMVTATVAPAECGPPAVPATSVACLQMQGGGAVTRCFPSDASGSARVVFDYVPGATYIATGRGCGAWIGQSPAPKCQMLGPSSAPL